MKTGHIVNFGRGTWTDPINYVVYCSILYVILDYTCGGILAKLGVVPMPTDLDVDEDLPNFFDSLKPSIARSIVTAD
jgi:hypothetical protein